MGMHQKRGTVAMKIGALAALAYVAYDTEAGTPKRGARTPDRVAREISRMPERRRKGWEAVAKAVTAALEGGKMAKTVPAAKAKLKGHIKAATEPLKRAARAKRATVAVKKGGKNGLRSRLD